MSSTICDDFFVAESVSESFSKTIAQRINVSISDTINPNIKIETTERAAKIFLYLHTCPKSLVTWKFLFKELFLKSTPKLMILTLNRLMISAETKNYKFFQIFQKIFDKLGQVLDLKYKYVDRLKGAKEDDINETLSGIKLRNLYLSSNYSTEILLCDSSFCPFSM